MKTIAEKLQPILTELEDIFLDRAARNLGPCGFSQEALRAATMIFQSVLLDKIWELQERENMPMEQREKMATHAGEQIRKLIKEMTGLDSTLFYK